MLHWKKPTELLDYDDNVAFVFKDRDGKETLQVGFVLGFKPDYSEFIIHFSYNEGTAAYTVTPDKIIAIRDKGDEKIQGHAGTFQILQPEHPLLNSNLEQ